MILQQLLSNFRDTVRYLRDLLRCLAMCLLSLLLQLPMIPVRDASMPPGPICNWLPIFGSLPLFSMEPSFRVLTKMAKWYGRIFRLQFGGTNFVVISNHELLQQTFSKAIAIGRHMPAMMDDMNHQGIVHADGDFWRTQRAFVSSTMRHLGMPPTASNNVFEEKATDAIDDFLLEVTASKGEPIFVDEALCFTLTNIFFSLIVGKSFYRHDSRLLAIINATHDSFQSMDPISFPNFVPRFAILPKQQQIMKDINSRRIEFCDYMRAIVEEHNKNSDPADLIDSFLLRMERDRANVRTSFTEDQLYYVLGDLFFAGLETTSTTIHWLLLAILNNPQIQDTIHYEMDNVIGSRQPVLSDKVHLPYLNAVLLEGLRFPSILPIGVFHSTKSHSTIDDYDIPVDTTVVGLFWKIHHDPTLWSSPNSFDPLNHMNENGNLVRARHLMPFSYGRRSCLGDDVAQNEIFLVFSKLLHKFKILPEDGAKLPSMDESLEGVLRAPLPFRIRAVTR